MTVKLTNNFLANARGITLTDGNGITWSINEATNSITASLTAASTGWGIPTGGVVQNNFAGGSASLAVTSAAVAKIIAALVAANIIGA